MAIDATPLAQGFHGEIVGPDHPSYEVHRRIWNGIVGRAGPVNSGRAIDIILRESIEIAHP